MTNDGYMTKSYILVPYIIRRIFLIQQQYTVVYEYTAFRLIRECIAAIISSIKHQHQLIYDAEQMDII